MDLDALAVPPAFLAARKNDDEALAWAESLPTLARDIRNLWNLHADGVARWGDAGVLLPVLDVDRQQAALKLQQPRLETTAAISGLRQWDGAGIVRMLDGDPERGALLLERLDASRPLTSVDDDEAAHVIGGLLARLHSTPPATGLPRLSSVIAGMLDGVPRAMAELSDSDDRKRILRWSAQVTDVSGDPGEQMLHWDLHHENVLASERAPWLAIDPEPLVGDPAFDLWPALDAGWSDDPRAADAARVVRRRFAILTERLSLDKPRAVSWTAGRLLQNALWDIEDGATTLSDASKMLDDALP